MFSGTIPVISTVQCFPWASPAVGTLESSLASWSLPGEVPPCLFSAFITYPGTHLRAAAWPPKVPRLSVLHPPLVVRGSLSHCIPPFQKESCGRTSWLWPHRLSPPLTPIGLFFKAHWSWQSRCIRDGFIAHLVSIPIRDPLFEHLLCCLTVKHLLPSLH